MEVRDRIQNFGRALSSMVMPNIGAFIAWGLLTALFIPTGWWPNEELSRMVGPILTYLLPLLIAYTAGYNIAGVRGGVTSAIATSGVIVGSDVPMFIGAMIMGPIAGISIKWFDCFTTGKIRAGFEMIIANFSIGIIGMLLAIVGYYTIGHAVSALTTLLCSCVSFLMQKGLLPLVSLFIEPAKVMFLNNAINHGIFSPIGIAQAQEAGKSIVFLLETNPGPGLGVLLAYWIFGSGAARSSAPGAAIIHFFGGIHEIYFPYILARPLLIVAPIIGSAAAITFYRLFDVGLLAPASPGSIIAVLAMSPKDSTFITLGGVIIATAVSFIIASPLVRRASRQNEVLPENRFRPKYKIAAEREATKDSIESKNKEINHIVFACDAGMGSSALGATRFRKRIDDLGTNIAVSHSAVNSIPATANIVVCQRVLAVRAKQAAPQSQIIEIDNFLSDPALDSLFERIASSVIVPIELPILQPENILVGATASDKWEAIRMAGELLISGGYVEKGYIDAMVERERLTTTCMGLGIAIPHGTSEAKTKVKHSGICVVQLPDGVTFDDENVQLIIGIAGVGDEHLDLLARISSVLEDEATLNRLKTTTDKQEIYDILK